MTKETYITNCQYISPVDAVHGGGIAIGDLLVLVLLLWLLLWLLYPIFHYLHKCRLSIVGMQRDSTHDRSCA